MQISSIIFFPFPTSTGWVRQLRLQLQQHQLRQAREWQRLHRSHWIIQLRWRIRSTPARRLRRRQLGIPRNRNQLPNHRCNPWSPQAKALLDRSLCCPLCFSLCRCSPCHSHRLCTCYPGSHPNPNPVEPRPRRRLQGVLKRLKTWIRKYFFSLFTLTTKLTEQKIKKWWNKLLLIFCSISSEKNIFCYPCSSFFSLVKIQFSLYVCCAEHSQCVKKMLYKFSYRIEQIKFSNFKNLFF